MKKTIAAVIIMALAILLIAVIPYYKNYIGKYKKNPEKTSLEESIQGSRKYDVNGSGSLVLEKPFGDILNTGELYEFDEDLYIYRTFLNEAQKRDYNQIYANAVEKNKDIILIETLSEKEIIETVTAVYNDHPELFYLDTTFSYSYSPEGLVFALSLNFNMEAEEIDQNEKIFTDAAESILNEAKKHKNKIDMEKYVFDYLKENVVYDENATLNQSPYSAIVNKASVCAGYSRAFQLIMNKLNIPCYYCVGKMNADDHAWNIVNIDGNIYNVDVSQNTGKIYFNVSDEMILVDHKRTGWSKYLPETSGIEGEEI